jgi:hypothetical protein
LLLQYLFHLPSWTLDLDLIAISVLGLQRKVGTHASKELIDRMYWKEVGEDV